MLLVQASSGYIAPTDRFPGFPVNIAALEGSINFHGSAIRAVAGGIVGKFNEMGIIGVFVAPDPAQIDSNGRDMRPAGDASLRLVIHTATLGKMRTIASGDRVPADQGIDHPKHRRIIEHAPLHSGDLLNKAELDRYIYHLNRHPGRRIDIAVAPGQQSGEAVVDFMAAEVKPWAVYYQLANSGADSTGEWRHRFGYINYQTFHRDDIFSVDFSTSFEGADSFNISYEAPLGGLDRLRWRVYGMWSQFDSEDIGQTGGNFEGEQWCFGADLIWNFFQYRQFFLDAVAGARWQNIEVENNIVSVNGEEDFFLPHAGLTAQYITDTHATSAMIDFERNLSGVAGTSSRKIERLGRTGVEPDYCIMRWSLMQSLYLEPFLTRKAWKDVTTPGSSTLAHELFFHFRGQQAFDDRLIPQAEGIVGGMYTVRGYDESETASDNMWIFTSEYRFHLPRVFAIDPDPFRHDVLGSPFRWAPQEVYGRPDWDLVFRGFLDVASTDVKEPITGEYDENLAGAGFGLEFLLRRNVRLRADFGWALKNAGRTDEGDSRFHFVATFLY